MCVSQIKKKRKKDKHPYAQVHACFSQKKRRKKKKKEKLHAQNKIKKAKVYTFRSSRRRRRGKVGPPREEEDETEEIGVREGEREETDFGRKGHSQNAAFQVRIFTFYFIFIPSPRRVRLSCTRTTQAWQANCRVRALIGGKEVLLILT